MKDVNLLIAAHKSQHTGKGRPLSVYTRSGVFLLSAAWEIYAEDVARECVSWLVWAAKSPDDLPVDVRNTLASSVRARSELAALGLAGNGWKDYVTGIAEDRTSALNTPNVANICSLFRECVGVNLLPLLGPQSERLQAFVKKRGDVAHQGVKAGHVSIKDLESDYEFVCKLVVSLDNFLILPMKEIIGCQPWNRR